MYLNKLLCLRTKLNWSKTRFLLLKRTGSREQVASFHRCFVLNTNPHSQENELKEESESDSETNSEESEKLTNLKLQILHAGLNFVHDHGWTKKSVALGAQSLGLSSASHTLINYGGADLVHYFNFHCNTNLTSYLSEHALEPTKRENIQEYIESALEKRLSMVYPYVSRWNEALSLMISPTQVPSDMKNLLELVDLIWSYSSSKNLNTTWYTKRLSLAVAYRLCEMSLIQDKSPEYSHTIEFLRNRVEMVLYSDEIFEQIASSGQHLPKLGLGALITAQNIFGLNRLFR